MSRISRVPVKLLDGVSCAIEGQKVSVRGAKGELHMTIPKELHIEILSEGVFVRRLDEESRHSSALSGTICRLVRNMMIGVSEGFEKKMELIGVGYRAELQDSILKLSLGFSHDVSYPIPAGISIKIEKPTAFTIMGMDKQCVGQVAAELRQYRPPEPYKGKGVHRVGDYVRRKEGKSK